MLHLAGFLNNLARLLEAVAGVEGPILPCEGATQTNYSRKSEPQNSLERTSLFCVLFLKHSKSLFSVSTATWQTDFVFIFLIATFDALETEILLFIHSAEIAQAQWKREHASILSYEVMEQFRFYPHPKECAMLIVLSFYDVDEGTVDTTKTTVIPDLSA